MREDRLCVSAGDVMGAASGRRERAAEAAERRRMQMGILDEMRKRRLFCDGGMGSLLQARGLQAGELPERWNLSHPEILTQIHREYLEAGRIL